MTESAAERRANTRKERAKLEEKQLRADMAEVLAIRAGRNVIWQVLERCRVFSQTYAGDPYATAFNEGRRSIGTELLAELVEEHLDSYLRMQTERLSKARADRQVEVAVGTPSSEESRDHDASDPSS